MGDSESQSNYQTQATADKVRVADATALVGFTRVEVDPWLWGTTGASTGLESADTTLTNPGP